MNSIPRLRTGLLRHPLDGQVLVYDSRADRVHLLDPTTACVLELLDEGGRGPDEISAEVGRRIGATADLQLIRLALQELKDADLLDPASVVEDGFSRRDAVRKLAAAGIAGVLIPTIATLAASRAYAQTLAGVGASCSSSGQCATNRCCGGLCRTAACTAHNGNCGIGVNPDKNTTVPDCTCCSGTCTQNGNNPDLCD